MNDRAARPAQLDDIARLLAEPSRLRMLWALGDGRSYTRPIWPGSELAPRSASNHSRAWSCRSSKPLARTPPLFRADLAKTSLGRRFARRGDLGECAAGAARRQPAPALRMRGVVTASRRECGVARWDRSCALRLIEPTPKAAPSPASSSASAARVEVAGRCRTRAVLPRLDRATLALGGAFGLAVSPACSPGCAAPRPRESGPCC